jgi:hypothetical protein
MEEQHELSTPETGTRSFAKQTDAAYVTKTVRQQDTSFGYTYTLCILHPTLGYFPTALWPWCRLSLKQK